MTCEKNNEDSRKKDNFNYTAVGGSMMKKRNYVTLSSSGSSILNVSSGFFFAVLVEISACESGLILLKRVGQFARDKFKKAVWGMRYVYREVANWVTSEEKKDSVYRAYGRVGEREGGVCTYIPHLRTRFNIIWRLGQRCGWRRGDILAWFVRDRVVFAANTYRDNYRFIVHQQKITRTDEFKEIAPLAWYIIWRCWMLVQFIKFIKGSRILYKELHHQRSWVVV